MQSSAEFIQRSLAAMQGGLPLPRDVCREWVRALMIFRDTPGITLDKALGLRPPQGKRRPWCEIAKSSRAQLLNDHFEKYLAPLSKHAASEVIAYHLQHTQEQRQPPPPREYLDLYQKLLALSVKIPTTQRQIYKHLLFTPEEPALGVNGFAPVKSRNEY